MTWLRKFWQDCHGGLSPSIAIIMMYLITVCGMGANAAYLVTQKMRLEGVADVIALEAMRGIRDTNRDLDGVRSYALNNARDAAGTGSIDINLLRDVTTIQFGRFDQKTMKFTEDEGNPEAVVVSLDFTADTGHPVRRMYYTAAGRFADMSVRRVAQFYTPRCYTSGIVAQGKLELSKDYMGFFNALRYGYPARLNPTYLTSNRVITVKIPRIGKRKPWRHASPSDYHVGRINYTSCWNKDTLVLNGGTYQNMVLVTNCRIDITQGVGFNNMILITTKGGKDSIEARKGLRLGSKNTACSSFVATVFMTRGGISASNAIKLFGAQLITYADDAHNKGSLPTTVLGGSVEMIGSSIFSGGNLRFNKSAKYTDCPNPTSKGLVKNDYIRMGVY